uniref:Uncharacterized protein n=1 Tax=Noctiluca scintillans TaxID=2966 RepID=A0A6T9EHY3_NOCSC|mmetsp:Transcript_53143/g.142098  ORF Transcript_53143/g.142098 Transcript_53143/m.142098 type:complete len:346 (+) Transcript_53143:74-1111(+)
MSSEAESSRRHRRSSPELDDRPKPMERSTIRPHPSGSSVFVDSAQSPEIDLDVTVLAFAQSMSEMKTRQHNSQHQMQAEMSVIRNAIAANNTDLADFKRHSAAIQQQMQNEICEIRDSLSNVFMDLTAAVRHNAATDQEIKLKVQALNEQAVRNETSFAQLADAAGQSQMKLRSAVTDMQSNSEGMREELSALNRYTEAIEMSLAEKADTFAVDVQRLGKDQREQLELRKEQLKIMVADVMLFGESLQSLVSEISEEKKGTAEAQTRLQATLLELDNRTQDAEDVGRPCSSRGTSEHRGGSIFVDPQLGRHAPQARPWVGLASPPTGSPVSSPVQTHVHGNLSYR